MYKALYRKWRPLTFSDVVGQEHVARTLKEQVASGRLSHAYLFTGTRGTGKTSCAKILSRAVNCLSPHGGDPCNECPSCRGILDGSVLDVVEMDAASNNGVDDIRELRDEIVYSPAAVKKRVYIIDEVHMLSGAAFNALLKTLEEPPAHVLFILATTEAHKVPATILSRCQKFAFRRISAADIAARLARVSEAEGLGLDPDAAALLARAADGSMRDALSLLDQCAAQGARLTLQQVQSVIGLAGAEQTLKLAGAIGNRDVGAALSVFGALYAEGKDLAAILDELSLLLRDLFVARLSPGAALSGGFSPDELFGLAPLFSGARLSYSLDTLSAAQTALRTGVNRRAEAEMCLIRLCDETLGISASSLLIRIERLEQGGVMLPAPAHTRQTGEAGVAPIQAKPADAAKSEVPAGAATESETAPGTGGESSGGGEDEAFWPRLREELLRACGAAEHSHLELAQADFDGSVLRLGFAQEFSVTLLKNRGAPDRIAAQAQAFLGREITVELFVKGARQDGRLDDWLAKNAGFDNITVK